jgi:hypothetical protein
VAREGGRPGSGGCRRWRPLLLLLLLLLCRWLGPQQPRLLLPLRAGGCMYSMCSMTGVSVLYLMDGRMDAQLDGCTVGWMDGCCRMVVTITACLEHIKKMAAWHDASGVLAAAAQVGQPVS